MTSFAGFSSVVAILKPRERYRCLTVDGVDRWRTVSYCYLNVKHRLMKNATLRQLRVFASVARHLSFIRAADELNLTAPAGSMQIKELQTEAGLRLSAR